MTDDLPLRPETPEERALMERLSEMGRPGPRLFPPQPRPLDEIVVRAAVLRRRTMATHLVAVLSVGCLSFAVVNHLSGNSRIDRQWASPIACVAPEKPDYSSLRYQPGTGWEVGQITSTVVLSSTCPSKNGPAKEATETVAAWFHTDGTGTVNSSIFLQSVPSEKSITASSSVDHPFPQTTAARRQYSTTQVTGGRSPEQTWAEWEERGKRFTASATGLHLDQLRSVLDVIDPFEAPTDLPGLRHVVGVPMDLGSITHTDGYLRVSTTLSHKDSASSYRLMVRSVPRGTGFLPPAGARWSEVRGRAGWWIPGGARAGLHWSCEDGVYAWLVPLGNGKGSVPDREATMALAAGLHRS